jgi:hypothetical protein
MAPPHFLKSSLENKSKQERDSCVLLLGKNGITLNKSICWAQEKMIRKRLNFNLTINSESLWSPKVKSRILVLNARLFESHSSVPIEFSIEKEANMMSEHLEKILSQSILFLLNLFLVFFTIQAPSKAK